MVNIGLKAVRCQNSSLTANHDLLQHLQKQQIVMFRQLNSVLKYSFEKTEVFKS